MLQGEKFRYLQKSSVKVHLPLKRKHDGSYYVTTGEGSLPTTKGDKILLSNTSTCASTLKNSLSTSHSTKTFVNTFAPQQSRNVGSYSTTKDEAMPSIIQNTDEDVLPYSATREEAMPSITQNIDQDLLPASSKPSISLKNSSFTKVGSVMELRSKHRNDSFVHLKKKDILEEIEEISNEHKNDDSSKKGRGVTKLRSCLPPKGEIWTVVLFQGQPVCEKGEKLKRALGCYARSENYFPLARQHWS